MFDIRHLTSDIFLTDRHRLPLWLPVLLGMGIGGYFSLENEPSLVAAAGAAAGLLAVTAAAWRHMLPRAIFLFLLVMACGFLLAAVRTHFAAAPVLSHRLFYREVEGRINDIRIKPKGETLVLSSPSIEEIDPVATPARVSVTFHHTLPGLRVGDRIRVKAMLFPPPGPAMPGSYDFARDFYFNRIGAVGYSPSKEVELLGSGGISGFEEWLNHVRLDLAARISAPMSPENGPVAAAMMVGEQTAVSPEVSDAMRDAGLYHVLSISGLHMSLAAGLMYFAVRLLLSLWPPLALRLPVKKIAAFIGIASAFIYLMLAGYPVPAVRSFVMVACVMLAVLFDRRGLSMYSLAWAALITLLIQPQSLLGASFQLSFAATVGIVALYEQYGHVLHKTDIGIVRTVRTYFFGLMVTSLVATLATTPLVVYHFNRFTAWGILANMLMIPLASFWIMPAAVLAFLALPFGLEYWPLMALDYGIGLMIEGCRWVAAMPFAAFALPSPTFWGILLFILGGLWLCLWQQKWRLLGVPLMLIGVCTIFLHRPYDILVSDDGTKVAVRLPSDEFLFLRGRADGFAAQVWLRAHGTEKGLTLKDVRDRPDAPMCDKVKCTLEIEGKRIVAAKNKKVTVEDLCNEKTDIVITETALDERACPWVSLLMDKYYLEKNRAVGVRIIGGAIITDTAAEHRGTRPWVDYKE